MEWPVRERNSDRQGRARWRYRRPCSRLVTLICQDRLVIAVHVGGDKMRERLTSTAEIIEYKGVQILFNDFSGLKGQEISDAIRACNKVMISKMASGKRDWLSINLFTNCFFDEAAQKALVKVHKAMVGFFVAIADVGLSRIQTIAIEIAASLAGSGVPLKFLDTVDEAKDWVVEVHQKTMKRVQ
jgi:hypothetical protein